MLNDGGDLNADRQVNWQVDLLGDGVSLISNLGRSLSQQGDSATVLFGSFDSYLSTIAATPAASSSDSFASGDSIACVWLGSTG